MFKSQNWKFTFLLVSNLKLLNIFDYSHLILREGFPCMAFSIGNVKKQKIEQIVFSKDSENFKKEIKKCGTLPGCNRCGWLKTS